MLQPRIVKTFSRQTAIKTAHTFETTENLTEFENNISLFFFLLKQRKMLPHNFAGESSAGQFAFPFTSDCT